MKPGLEALDDYVTGTMQGEEADAFEEALFAAAARGEDHDARWFERFNLLWFARGEVLIRPTTAADIDAMRGAGLDVCLLEWGAGGDVEYTPSDAQYVVTRVGCDVRGYDAVVTTIENPDGRVLHTFPDCLGEPGTGHLYAVCGARLANLSWGGGPRVIRVTGAKQGAAERQQIALYRLTPVAR